MLDWFACVYSSGLVLIKLGSCILRDILQLVIPTDEDSTGSTEVMNWAFYDAEYVGAGLVQMF
jgi:hypothetical protein